MKVATFLTSVIASIAFIAGCGGLALNRVAPESITEISESSHTGLGRSSFEIILRRDGTAEITCVFYRLNTEPEVDSMQVTMIPACGHLFKNNRGGFVKKPDSGSASEYELTGAFKGTITPEQFENLAKLVVDNRYFSFADKYDVPGLMDAPPTHTKVVYTTGKKEISDQAYKGGPKLKEIEDAIYQMTKDIPFQ